VAKGVRYRRCFKALTAVTDVREESGCQYGLDLCNYRTSSHSVGEIFTVQHVMHILCLLKHSFSILTRAICKVYCKVKLNVRCIVNMLIKNAEFNENFISH